MTDHGFWKTCLKIFLLIADADSKRQDHVGRSYDPMDERWCPRDPAFNGLHEQMIHDAKVNADPERGA